MAWVGCAIWRGHYIRFGNFPTWGGGTVQTAPSGNGEMGSLKGRRSRAIHPKERLSPRWRLHHLSGKCRRLYLWK